MSSNGHPVSWVVEALQFDRISTVEFHFLRSHLGQIRALLEQTRTPSSTRFTSSSSSFSSKRKKSLAAKNATNKTPENDADLLDIPEWFDVQKLSNPVLSLCYSLLDLDPITDQRDFVPDLLGNGNSNNTQVLTVKYRFTLHPESCRAELEILCLEIIGLFFHQMSDKTALFAHWNIVLPGSSFNPFKVSLLDKVMTRGKDAPQGVTLTLRHLAVLQTFVERCGFHFAFVEKRPLAGRGRGGATGFIPVYQSLGVSLGLAVEKLAQIQARGWVDMSVLSCVTKALVLLTKLVPFQKLESTRPLEAVLETATSLVDQVNPVSQISGLNLLLAISGVPATHRPITDEDITTLFTHLAFVKKASKDNNVRYVVLQGLCTMVAQNHSLSLSCCRALLSSIDKPFVDTDNSILLHTLRLFKAIAKVGAETDDAGGEHLALWLAILKPQRIQLLEERQEQLLMAAFCDSLAELPENVYVSLPVDKRMLYVTYLLNHTEDPDFNVRNSSMRGLGVLVSFKTSVTDTALLMDCTDRIVPALETSTHCKNFLTNATWALANLSDTLLALAGAATSGQLAGGDVGYPMHYVARLMRLTTTILKGKVTAHLVNTKVNCLRSAGCLLMCHAAFLTPGTGLPQDAQTELDEIVRDSLEAVFHSIKVSTMMKVKWNGCYALSKIVQNKDLVAKTEIQSQIMDVVRDAMENCENFKV